MSSISRIRSGAELLKEVLRAADVSRNDNGRVSGTELSGMLKGEGYRSGPIVNAPTRIHRYAQKLSGEAAPKLSATDAAVDRALRAIERAAARDGNRRTLSADEYNSLSATAKAVVDFGRKYGDDTFDELFF